MVCPTHRIGPILVGPLHDRTSTACGGATAVAEPHCEHHVCLSTLLGRFGLSSGRIFPPGRLAIGAGACPVARKLQNPSVGHRREARPEASERCRGMDECIRRIPGSARLSSEGRKQEHGRICPMAARSSHPLGIQGQARRAAQRSTAGVATRRLAEHVQREIPRLIVRCVRTECFEACANVGHRGRGQRHRTNSGGGQRKAFQLAKPGFPTCSQGACAIAQLRR
mmetsp:Transcript_1663/g.10209  ORF Transcript_1663/g.10209 Transcript_1663/m.10209 type:complete len:225 (+) Transcript_1663:1925-2599(+)